MTTTYSATLSDGSVAKVKSRVADYFAAVQGVTWTGELRIVSMSRTLGSAIRTAAKLKAGGMRCVRVLELSRS